MTPDQIEAARKAISDLSTINAAIKKFEDDRKPIKGRASIEKYTAWIKPEYQSAQFISCSSGGPSTTYCGTSVGYLCEIYFTPEAVALLLNQRKLECELAAVKAGVTLE